MPWRFVRSKLTACEFPIASFRASWLTCASGSGRSACVQKPVKPPRLEWHAFANSVAADCGIVLKLHGAGGFAVRVRVGDAEAKAGSLTRGSLRVGSLADGAPI